MRQTAAIAGTAAAALLAGAGPVPAQHARSYERFAAFLSFFEPETAALLHVSEETGRISDLGEDGLAARARGYRELRDGLAGPPLFPQAPPELAAALDPALFLDRRIAGFLRVREWARSPLYYVRAAANALASVEFDPGLDPADRRRALTRRARQAPYLLDAASAALVNPPRVLANQAVAEGRVLELWIADASARAARLPEGGEKWALAQSLEAANDAVAAFREGLEADFGPRANGSAALGEAVVSDLARTYGFDGAYHVAEILARASDAMEAAAAFGRPAPPDSGSAASLASAVAARWPGAAVPAVATRFGPPVAGRGPVSVAWRPGAAQSSGGLAWIHVDAARTAAPRLLEAAVAEAVAQAWIRQAVGASGQSPSRAAARLIVAWDGLAPAARWFALAARAAEAGPGRGGGGGNGESGPRIAADLAHMEAEAARVAALLHLGLLDAREADERLASIPPAEGARLLAGHVSDPNGVFAPALGMVFLERWRQDGRPPPASLFEEWLRGGEERP